MTFCTLCSDVSAARKDGRYTTVIVAMNGLHNPIWAWSLRKESYPQLITCSTSGHPSGPHKRIKWYTTVNSKPRSYDLSQPVR